MSDLQTALDSLCSALPDYVTAAQFYDGNVSELFFSNGMKRQLARAGNIDLRVNLAKIAVDVVAQRLEVSAVSAPDEGSQTALDALGQANELDLMLPSLFLTALEYGDAYLLLDGDSETGVNLFEHSPLTTRVIYSPDNPRVKAFAIKRWGVSIDGQDFVRVNLYYADRIERYVTTKAGAQGVNDSEYTTYTDPTDDTDDDSTIPHDYGFVPVYHFRAAGRPYGLPEHRECYGPQNAINKLAITHLATIDFMGFPQRYVMAGQGGDASEIDDFDAPMFHDPVEPDATSLGPSVSRGSTQGGQSGLTADPGGVWWLNSAGEVGQFDAADSSNFINSIGLYVRLMAQSSNTPLHYFDPSGDTPSGESLRVADAPLVKKVRHRSLEFGGALQDALTDAMTVLGYDVSPVVHWASFEATDSLDTWQVAQAKINAGVPAFDAFQQAGVTPEQLDAMGITREQPLSDEEKLERLGKIADSVNKLAVAVTAGIIDATMVQQLIVNELGEAA